jgi:phosphoglycerate kinase
LEISKYVLDKGIADHILTGGVVGQVFLVANGYDLGKHNMEFLEKEDLMKLVPGIRDLTHSYQGSIRTPVDVAVDMNGKRSEIAVTELPTEYSIFDIGIQTADDYCSIIRKAKSIVVSGPMGKYEDIKFKYGTKAILQEIARSGAFSIAGGGHTIAALELFGLADKVSYVSTAGGALVEFLMGKKLPGVVALEKAATTKK